MKRILTIIGTRPEAIKLAPVILELDKRSSKVQNLVCVTAQHREMLDQILEWFQITPTFDLNLMQKNQNLAEFCSRALISITNVLLKIKPDAILVQGDTTTAMVGALAGFYQRIPVGHVEAGLRTGNRYNPFPEEINRRILSVLATFHFAPTERAAASLKTEAIPEENIFLTGNTVVDSLLFTIQRPVELNLGFDLEKRKLLLVTAHRRESFGAPLEALCWALHDLIERNEDIEIVYPVHMNPNVQEPVTRILSNHPRIHLLEPMRYEQFAHLMKKAYLILTDSGGIQEEAPVLGKPTLVLRETTERPEAIEAGTALLVGTKREQIIYETERLLRSEEIYRAMSKAGSPFGDGHASERIVNVLLSRV